MTYHDVICVRYFRRSLNLILHRGKELKTPVGPTDRHTQQYMGRRQACVSFQCAPAPGWSGWLFGRLSEPCVCVCNPQSSFLVGKGDLELLVLLPSPPEC